MTLSFTRGEQPTDTDRAYAAGLIDGEGCIRIGRGMTKKGTYLYYLEVMASSSTPVLMEWLEARWGGSSIRSKRPVGMGKVIMTRWRVSALRAEAFLEDIYPFLVLKREQAMYARSFQQISAMHRGRDTYREWEELKLKMYQKVSDLKRERGKHHPRRAA